ncbi:MAG: NADH-quinone oxidoreductase subunit J [Oligoflexia bacterium]|nr:NADH-quinone oxidoreductase subunit J [Oligoflexia bacterium]
MDNFIILIQSIITALLALFVLFSRSVLNSTLFFLSVLVSTAALYLLLNETLLASIQIIVYAGAIVILFIFTIMLLNIKSDLEKNLFSSPVFFIGSITSLLAFYMLATSVRAHYHSPNHLPLASSSKGIFSEQVILTQGGNSKAIAIELFSHYFILFELISIILLVAMVSAIVLAKRNIKQ